MTELGLRNFVIQRTTAAVQARAKEVFSKIPLSFELNRGQSNEEVRFVFRGAGLHALADP
jgi:hypothetical protein